MGTGFNDELRLRILLSTIQVFNTHGMRFTMDDIASYMKISKKTIYTVYKSKDDMMLDMVDYLFDSIAVSKKKILDNPDMPLKEKIKAYLIGMPDSFQSIKFTELFLLRDKYPHIYAKVRDRLDSDWEPAFELLRKGQKDGIIKKDANLPLFKVMMENSISAFFESDILKKLGLSYREGLETVADILLDGIKA
ncbi:MAG: TetR/AcrR family transcriptional regulator [Clostridiales bacterium]|nr:TetR/AcrR family transcriptional regulator [Clostridiales bacterium]